MIFKSKCFDELKRLFRLLTRPQLSASEIRAMVCLRCYSRDKEHHKIESGESKLKYHSIGTFNSCTNIVLPTGNRP